MKTDAKFLEEQQKYISSSIQKQTQIVNLLERRLRLLGTDKKVSNISIIINNKLIELGKIFERQELSFYESNLGKAIIIHLLKLEVYSKEALNDSLKDLNSFVDEEYIILSANLDTGPISKIKNRIIKNSLTYKKATKKVRKKVCEIRVKIDKLNDLAKKALLFEMDESIIKPIMEYLKFFAIHQNEFIKTYDEIKEELKLFSLDDLIPLLDEHVKTYFYRTIGNSTKL